MDTRHLKFLKSDMAQICAPKTRSIIKAKLLYYFFQRSIANIFLKFYLKRHFLNDDTSKLIDFFLLGQGGMFKKYVYKICDNYCSLKGSTILVPGVGYGRNLFQLSAFRPKRIISFDLFEYQQEWNFLKEEISKKFNVEVIFYKGNIEDVPADYESSFDFVISDAVLEHVTNLNKFVKACSKFLKNNGIFYASFGPIWYGPGGDHIFWGDKRIFDHLILPKKTYEKNLNEKSKLLQYDSCNGVFLSRNKLFSYLPAGDYFKVLSRANFKKLLAYAKISKQAIHLTKKNPKIWDMLEEKQVPRFDRFCSGIYLWMRSHRGDVCK